MSENNISPEVMQYIQNLDKQLEGEKLRRMTAENQLGNTSLPSASGRDLNVVELQLDLEKMLDKAFHMLSSHEVKFDREKNIEYWAEPDDDSLKTFSVFGVKKIMEQLVLYLNINTLMSFWDDINAIKLKVYNFAIELADLFENMYEHILYYPSPEDLYERYLPIVTSKGLKITEAELYEKCVKWSEDEREKRENMLSIIHNTLKDMVHNVYMRAYRGMERKSIGERGINISQSNNEIMLPTPIKKPGIIGRLTG